MKRTNISLTDEQHNWLYEKAHKAKIGMAELIRIMIDESMSKGPHVDRNTPKKNITLEFEEQKVTYPKTHRDDSTLGGSSFSPQPKSGKKKK